MKARLTLDLTPFVRGPFTGTGLVAFHVAEALGKIQAEQVGACPWTLQYVSKKRAPETLNNLSLKKPGFGELFMGHSREIFHSFDMKLPRVYRSTRVLTIHDLWTLRQNPFQSKEFQKKQSARIRSALERADWVVTISQHVRAQLLESFPNFKNRSTAISLAPFENSHDGLDSIARDVQSHESECIQQLCSSRVKFVLMVATLETRKNHGLLCRALKKHPSLKAVLVGAKGFGFENIASELASCEDQLIYFEKIPQALLTKLYQSAMATVLPSFDEGFGLPVVEAMKLGCPVIASRIAPFLEIGGAAPFFVDPNGTGEDLSEALRLIESDEQIRSEKIQLGLREAAKFSWSRAAQEHARVYKNLIAQTI